MRIGGGEHGADDAVHAEQPRRSEEHTSELQSRLHLVCRLLLEKKKRCINESLSLSICHLAYDACSRHVSLSVVAVILWRYSSVSCVRLSFHQLGISRQAAPSRA